MSKQYYRCTKCNRPNFFTTTRNIDFSNRYYDLVFVTGTKSPEEPTKYSEFHFKNPSISSMKTAVVGVAQTEISINFSNNTFLECLEQALKVYSNAKIFCMPSFYESFAIPALESYACGCNLVLSNQGAPKSIFGQRAEYFDPNDFAGMEDAIKHSLPSQKTIDLEMMKELTWSNSAKKFDELFH